MKEIVEDLKQKINEMYEHLHENPEISWKEYETTKFIESQLKKLGWSTATFDDCPGVIAEKGEGTPVVAIRADMDALWQAVDGVFQANHSCGHDAHMTMVLGVAFVLQRTNYLPQGKLKLIFQPAEEKGTGALKMVEKKVIDDIDYMYGVHLRPKHEVENKKAAPAIIHGAGKFISGEIKGTDSHGARPHLGTNAIEVGAAIVSHLKGIHLDPMVPHSVKMTKFIAGGDSSNIIPGSALFSLDMRAQTNKQMSLLSDAVANIFTTLSSLYGVDICIDEETYVPAAEVNESALKIMESAIATSLGENNVVPPIITSGGEDFHFYTIKRPHLKATMLGLGCDLQPGLHHPNMSFDQAAMLDGIEILARAIILTFAREGKMTN